MVLLCGAATAVAGPIAFVGLVVPHVARLITGPDYRWVLPYSLVLAPILLLGSDIIGRVVVRPAELQVGIVTAIVGAPFFIWLVRRRDMARAVTAVAIVAAARRQARARSMLVCAGLALAAAIVLCLSVSVGSFPVPLTEVVPAILGFGSPDAEIVIQTLRLPRALCALLVGFAFGASGAVFQSLARNELAGPDIIGITAGAGTAAVLMIVVARASSAAISLAALAGALATALAIYLLAYRRGLAEYRLILVGIGIGRAARVGDVLPAHALGRSPSCGARRCG